mgnify:CR=1 FL=1
MDIAEVLRQNGYKVTPQRLAVYAVIEHNPAHPNAEAIYRELQPQYPSMSLATVYRSLRRSASSMCCSAEKTLIVTIIIRRLMRTFGVPNAIRLRTCTWIRNP